MPDDRPDAPRSLDPPSGSPAGAPADDRPAEAAAPDRGSRDGEGGSSAREEGSTPLPRRDLLKLGAAGLAAAAASPVTGCVPDTPDRPDRTTPERPAGPPGVAPPASLGDPPADLPTAPPIETVRIGMVGVGLQGTAHVRNFLNIDGCVITAVADIVPEKVARVQDMVEEAGFPRPTGYARSETDFERLCREEELDLVFTSTPWEWHVPVCLAAMENGKHAATEVPAAYTMEGCWALVEAAERTGRHCVMMENVNYGRMEMMMFVMAREGLFGELLHGEGGYLHDLRAIKFEDANEGLWRRAHSMHRNGNLYPTHGLGPIANCMDINRGDQFARLVSMSSPSRGLQAFAEDNYPEGHPKRQEAFKLGDVNTSIIQTALGRTITVVHDTNLPRPYSRINKLQGTKGLFHGYPHRVHIEGRSPEHRWEEAEAYLDEYDHPLWRQMEERSRGAGHGGMDFMEDYRLVKCLREGLPTDMNVYDAAALSVVTPLSEWSVANGGAPADFPDFTRGRWRSWPPLPIVEA